ncbi:MAG: FKBP-type peptidyl-prolyl cis-trans isomerase, partial [bacterium]|nr:FKBP-type peptidyl-prolyl cis-trans isomerase [bacterium]
EVIIYHYKGTLPDGTVFDSSFDRKTPFAFTLGRKQVIKGVEEAFGYFGVGAKGTMIIPPDLAYGAKQRGAIPPNSTLRFDIEVLEIKAHGLADLLQETIDTAGLAAAQAKFAEVQAAKFDGLYVSESQLKTSPRVTTYPRPWRCCNGTSNSTPPPATSTTASARPT